MTDDACVISDHLVAFWYEPGRPWLIKNEMFLLFSDQQKAMEFAIVPGCPAQQMVVQMMDGYDNLLETLRFVQAAGAKWIGIDPPPGDGVQIGGTGIGKVITDVEQILQGREDVCSLCGHRIIECACVEGQAEA